VEQNRTIGSVLFVIQIPPQSLLKFALLIIETMLKLGTTLHEIQLLMLFAMVLKVTTEMEKLLSMIPNRNPSRNLLQKRIYIIVLVLIQMVTSGAMK